MKVLMRRFCSWNVMNVTERMFYFELLEKEINEH